MNWLPIVFKVADAGLAVAQKVDGWLEKRRAAKKAARAWAERPNQPKGCQRCRTLNYLGGDVCSNCGWPI